MLAHYRRVFVRESISTCCMSIEFMRVNTEACHAFPVRPVSDLELYVYGQIQFFLYRPASVVRHVQCVLNLRRCACNVTSLFYQITQICLYIMSPS